MDPGLLDHFLFVILVVVEPVLGTREYRRFLHRVDAGIGDARFSQYRRVMIQQWGLVAMLLVVWLLAGRTHAELGLGMEPNTRMWIGWAATLVVACLALAQTIVILRSDKRTEALRQEFDSLLGLVPHDDREMRAWTALSITAGVCEELLYRGFLITYLTSLFGLWPAVALSSVLFGIVHAYQGPAGVAKAAVIGLAMAGLFVLTGSLWASMILHAIIDLNSGYLARRALDALQSTAT